MVKGRPDKKKPGELRDAHRAAGRASNLKEPEVPYSFGITTLSIT